MDIDLLSLYYSKVNGRRCVSEANSKWFVRQLLRALAYCHENNVVHRDVKSSNIFVNVAGELRLGDFGLARELLHDTDERARRLAALGKPGADRTGLIDSGDSAGHVSLEQPDALFDDDPMYTNRVVTLWYRPPELLLGATLYGPEIDAWAVGCVLVELITATPLFPGRSEFDQLQRIAVMLGAPPAALWPSGFRAMTTGQPPTRLESHASLARHRNVLSLCTELLQLMPSRRISCRNALKHIWFDEQATGPAEPPDANFYKVPSLMNRLTQSQAGQQRESLDRSWQLRQSEIARRDANVMARARAAFAAAEAAYRRPTQLSPGAVVQAEQLTGSGSNESSGNQGSQPQQQQQQRQEPQQSGTYVPLPTAPPQHRSQAPPVPPPPAAQQGGTADEYTLFKNRLWASGGLRAPGAPPPPLPSLPKPAAAAAAAATTATSAAAAASASFSPDSPSFSPEETASYSTDAPTYSTQIGGDTLQPNADESNGANSDTGWLQALFDNESAYADLELLIAPPSLRQLPVNQVREHKSATRVWMHRAIVCTRCPSIAALIAAAPNPAASPITVVLVDESPNAARGVFRWLYGGDIGVSSGNAALALMCCARRLGIDALAASAAQLLQSAFESDTDDVVGDCIVPILIQLTDSQNDARADEDAPLLAAALGYAGRHWRTISRERSFRVKIIEQRPSIMVAILDALNLAADAETQLRTADSAKAGESSAREQQNRQAAAVDVTPE